MRSQGFVFVVHSCALLVNSKTGFTYWHLHIQLCSYQQPFIFEGYLIKIMSQNKKHIIIYQTSNSCLQTRQLLKVWQPNLQQMARHTEQAKNYSWMRVGGLQHLQSKWKCTRLFWSSVYIFRSCRLMPNNVRNYRIMLSSVTYFAMPPVVYDTWLSFRFTAAVSIMMFLRLYSRIMSQLILYPPKMHTRKLLLPLRSSSMAFRVNVSEDSPYVFLRSLIRASYRFSPLMRQPIEVQMVRGAIMERAGIIV